MIVLRPIEHALTADIDVQKLSGLARIPMDVATWKERALGNAPQEIEN